MILLRGNSQEKEVYGYESGLAFPEGTSIGGPNYIPETGNHEVWEKSEELWMKIYLTLQKKTGQCTQ